MRVKFQLLAAQSSHSSDIATQNVWRKSHQYANRDLVQSQEHRGRCDVWSVARSPRNRRDQRRTEPAAVPMSTMMIWRPLQVCRLMIAADRQSRRRSATVRGRSCGHRSKRLQYRVINFALNYILFFDVRTFVRHCCAIIAKRHFAREPAIFRSRFDRLRHKPTRWRADRSKHRKCSRCRDVTQHMSRVVSGMIRATSREKLQQLMS